jgi:hypothetical protein
MQQDFTPLLAILALVLAVVALSFFLKKKGGNQHRHTAEKQPAVPINDEITSLCQYFDDVNRTRTFPVAPLDMVKPRRGEFGLISERANLYEMRSHRQSVGLSVRVARGVYVGRRSYISKDHLDRTAVGAPVLTNQRILFVSTAKTIAIPIDKIIAAQADRNWLQIHSEKRQRPVTFEVAGAQLAALLIAFFLRNPLAGNALPKDMTITATPNQNRDVITLSIKNATEERPAAPYLVSGADQSTPGN